jgi:hypothetical protein
MMDASEDENVMSRCVWRYVEYCIPPNKQIGLHVTPRSECEEEEV